MRTLTRSRLVALLAAALLLAACGGGGDDEGSTEDIVIGHPGDFSGDYSFYDSPMRAGAELAIDEINKEGGPLGRKLVYKAIDTRNDQTEALRATEELIDDGAVYIIGTTGAPWSAQASVACQAGVPISTGDGTSPDLVEQAEGECAHQVIMSDNVQAAVAAEYALSKGWKTAHVMKSSDDAYTLGVPKYFTDAFEEGGGEVTGETEFKIGAGDYSVQATQIANLPEQPDFIHTPIFAPDTQVFLRQLRAQGVDTQVVGADGSVDNSVLDAGKAVEGMVATYHAWPSDDNAELTEFIDSYKAFHGEEPESMVAGLGYDEIHMIAQLIEDAGEASSEALIEGLQSLEFDGVTGSLTMDPETRRVDKEVTLVEFKDKKINFLDSLVPSYVPSVGG
jgi:branched-chain amino acid transport system substrate-binding protein